ERMTHHALQDMLYTATNGLTGKDFEKALVEFAKRDTLYKGIRRVWLCEPLKVIPIHDIVSKVYKAYKGDANARFDVWGLPGGKWVNKWKDRDGTEHSGVISMFDAHQQDREPPKPHPAAKRVLSLRQNDLIAVERE